MRFTECFDHVFLQESMVVCRVRRNGDFRLTESSRGSSDHRNLSAIDNGDYGTNEYANTQRDGFDEANTQMDGFDRDSTHMDGFHKPNNIKSCSKGSTSSYRSHSVEQNDSESESHQQLIHDSPHGSSSHKVRFLFSVQVYR